MYAGILLLFKHKLALLSPAGSDDVLIKKRVSPKLGKAGEIIWAGEGGKTVDVRQIKERFESLGIDTHWDRIKKINNLL